jgi:hypothetical protein
MKLIVRDPFQAFIFGFQLPGHASFSHRTTGQLNTKKKIICLGFKAIYLEPIGTLAPVAGPADISPLGPRHRSTQQTPVNNN